MADLSDQEIEQIAQRIVADLTDHGGAVAKEKPAKPSLAGDEQGLLVGDYAVRWA